ncbi:MAG: hypothetical protein ABFD07_08580 [Methanobacterium sp.]
MKIDKYGRQVFNDNDLLDVYLTDPDIALANIIVEHPLDFPDFLDLENIPKNILLADNSEMSVEEYDTISQNNWFIPEEYRNFDIAKFILDQCTSDSELQRAGEELLLYQERDMFMLLRYLKYLVDIMRKNNVVWGVGRGSSVSSFVLYLIGVHKINSLYYDLDIREFLKDS